MRLIKKYFNQLGFVRSANGIIQYITTTNFSVTVNGKKGNNFLLNDLFIRLILFLLTLCALKRIYPFYVNLGPSGTDS